MKEFFIKHKTKIIFAIIMLIAVVVRIYLWPKAISQINCDEAMTAVNALSISETGKDTYGTSFPVYLEAWGVFGQSVVLAYIMAFFIKIFGFSYFTIRLPMLFISIISLFVFYDLLKKIFKKESIALLGTAFLAICPWHIMQSIWSIDCNMFPHFMLISVYLLYRGITDKKYFLYLSMIFFAISMYTYGVSVYVIPLFLLITAIYLLKTKKVHIKDLIICIIIYVLFSLPILTMYVLNFFKIDTDIHIGPITIQYFENNTRTSDMLFFSSDFMNTLKNNIIATLKTVFVGYDSLEWNATPIFGTIYHISIIFFIIGSFAFIRKKLMQDENTKTGITIIWIWLILSLILGLIIKEVNINRLNVVWYPIIFFTILGISSLLAYNNKKLLYGVCTVYGVLFISFSIYFYGYYTNKIDVSGCFSRRYIDAVHFASKVGTKDNNNNIFYFDEKNDGALEVYTKVQAKIDNADIKKISDREELIKQIDLNSIIIIHKDYVQNNSLFNESFDISNHNRKNFEDYVVIYK